MLRFRTHLPLLIRQVLALWLLAFAVAASQGCLSLLPHDLTVAHEIIRSADHVDSHELHASGCLQYCEHSSTALSPTLTLPTFEHTLWAVVFLLPALILSARSQTPFAFLTLHRPAPPRSASTPALRSLQRLKPSSKRPEFRPPPLASPL
ncbi:hypothetical protein [Pseudomonas rossensis]|uniref:hypothetical protein n=1 Tax=Pseudomonas rossensis TaxID=2305471 RepID=UPI0032613BA8